MSLSKFVPPRVGCQHFLSVVKNIRSEPNTLLSACMDILDNIYGIAKSQGLQGIVAELNFQFNPSDNTIYQISISDNIPHGFKKILDESTDNPLNMGHIRDGHSDDKESSEFGTGLKKAIIYLSEHAEIYTRSINDDEVESIIKVTFDIPSMCSKENPQDSYEPTRFALISLDTYKENHSFEEGSSIILSNLHSNDFTYDQDSGKMLSQQGFIDCIKGHLRKAYSPIIRDEIFAIKLNGPIIEADEDIVSLVSQKNKFSYIYYVEINAKRDPVKIFREGKTPKGKPQLTEYHDKECKFKTIYQSDLDEFIQKENVHRLDLIALTTKSSEVGVLSYNFTDITRGGRTYEPPIKFIKPETDGYSNHIYNRITYDSKKLNKALGVGSNKRVTRQNNILSTAIQETQKHTTREFRKFCKSKEDTFQASSDSDESFEIAPKPNPPKAKPKAKAKAKVEDKVDDDKVEDNKSDDDKVEDDKVEDDKVEDDEVEDDKVQDDEVDDDKVDDNKSNDDKVEDDKVQDDEVEDDKVEELPNPEPVKEDLFKESREQIQDAAKKLMEMIADPGFNRKDGHVILEFVNNFVN